MDLTQLIEISRFYGEGTDFVISGGGNTSVKDAERMAIKASGAALRGITEAGFVELARKPVRAILGRSYPEEPFAREARIKADLLASRTNPESGGRPSVEASLHESIEYRYVVHTHPFLVNALTSARDGEKQAARLFGDEALYLRYCDPGYTLAVHLHEALEGYRKAAWVRPAHRAHGEPRACRRRGLCRGDPRAHGRRGREDQEAPEGRPARGRASRGRCGHARGARPPHDALRGRKRRKSPRCGTAR